MTDPSMTVTSAERRIYVASSWRNPHQPAAVQALRAAGFAPYDFRNPGPGERGFSWREIEPGWQQWSPEQFRRALDHPIARHGFGNDFRGMREADACLLVNPSGRSAHIEAGWMAGAGKPVVILLAENDEPELMYLLTDALATTLPEAVDLLRTLLLQKR